jgi:hypothetical protein
MRASLFAVLAAGLLVARGADAQTSAPFSGAKVNGGTVSHTHEKGRHVLALSSDFQVPDTPDPHWQVVDSSGRTYLLQRLPIKGDKVNRTITVPAYVADVATVQIWCAFAETLLGEASFATPVSALQLDSSTTTSGTCRRLSRAQRRPAGRLRTC